MRKIFWKINISYPLIRTRTCKCQGVNVDFSGNSAYAPNQLSLMISLLYCPNDLNLILLKIYARGNNPSTKKAQNHSSWNNIFSPSKDLLKVNNKNRGVAKTPTIWNEERKVLATPLKTLDYRVECVQSEQNTSLKLPLLLILNKFESNINPLNDSVALI